MYIWERGDMKLPTTSRGWQMLQHFVSGMMQIMNYVTAGTAGITVMGTFPVWAFGMIALATFILNRISSEISYQTSSKLFEEHRK
jgi:hypothetical protein